MTLIPLTVIQNYLKEQLSLRIEDQYAKETAFLANIEKNVGVEPESDKFKITVVKSMHSGVAAVGKGENLPTGYAPTARVELSSKYLFAGFSIEDQDLERARKSEQALGNVLTLNESQMRTALAKQLNRMFLQNGDGAVTSANGSGSNSTTLTVNNSTPNADIAGTEYLAEGQYIVIGTADPVKIASVDSDTQVTLALARSWSDSDKVYITGPDGTKTAEPDGLVSAIATVNNTFQTIDRTANPWWIPQVFSDATTYDTARELEGKMQKMLLKANKYGKIKVVLMNQSPYNRFAADLQSLQRIVNSVELKGGFKGLSFAGPGYDVAVVLDYDTPDGDVLGVDTGSLTRAQLAALQWLELDGSGNILRLAGKATWEGFLKHYVNLGLRKARSNFAITGGTFTV